MEAEYSSFDTSCRKITRGRVRGQLLRSHPESSTLLSTRRYEAPLITLVKLIFFSVAQSGELELCSKFPKWDPELHYTVSVLTYIKKIFYNKDFSTDGALNEVANEL
jgi:hypothetical protein